MEPSSWDAAATAWTDHVRSRDVRWETHAATLTQLLPPPRGLTIDVGCGEGRFTRQLRALGYDVVGLDATARLVGAAQEADPDGSYAVADIRSLPMDDGRAGLVTCVNVLQHIEALDAALAEIARVLAPHGVVVAAVVHPIAEVSTYDGEKDALSVERYFVEEPHRVPLGNVEVVHYHRTIESYVGAFRAAGFILDELREVPGKSVALPLYLDLRAARERF